MRFQHPQALMLFAVLPVIWLFAARAKRVPPRARTVWRMVASACLILGISGLAVALSYAPVTAVIVVDRSGSMPSGAERQALDAIDHALRTMRAGDRLGVVTFGAGAALERRPAQAAPLPAFGASVDTGETDIASGLRLARSVAGTDASRRILLFSDGRQTRGRAEQEAAYAAASAIPIDVIVPPVVMSRGAAAVTRVSAPPEVRAGEPFLVSVRVDGAAGAGGMLTVDRDDQPFASRQVVVPSEGMTIVTLSDVREAAGPHVYRAALGQPDALQNDAAGPVAGAVVTVEGPPAVLEIAASPGHLAGVLRNSGFRVAHTSPGDIPSTAALSVYDAVVLDDVGADALSETATARLAEYVEQNGGGLLLLGSARTLEPGGYPAGPLGPVLPIDLRPRSGRRATSAGIVLVIDKSGSMADIAAGTPKIEIARQAIRRVLDIVPASDRVGVIAFDAAPTEVVPFGQALDGATLDERLRRIEPAGSTRVAPAIEMAVQWLDGTGSSLSTRQIVLVSDGRTSPADTERSKAATHSRGIEVSTVAIGENADRAFLEELAESTGGRAYFPADLRDLPRIVAREAVRSATGSVVSEPFTVRASAHPILTGLDTRAMPRLTGYVVSTSRPTASDVLVSHLDDPLLSAWQAGLGRAAVFTAGLGSPWSQSFASWPGYSQLWTQTVRWLSRRTRDDSLQLAWSDASGTLRVSLDMEGPDGRFLDAANPRAFVRRPDGALDELELHALAPGRYQAVVPSPVEGPYVVSAMATDARSGSEHRVTRGLYWSAERERRTGTPDIALLQQLAATTGGHVLTPVESPFAGNRSRAYADVSRGLVMVALWMFIGELVIGADRLGPALARRIHAPLSHLTAPVRLLRRRT